MKQIKYFPQETFTVYIPIIELFVYSWCLAYGILKLGNNQSWKYSDWKVLWQINLAAKYYFSFGFNSFFGSMHAFIPLGDARFRSDSNIYSILTHSLPLWICGLHTKHISQKLPESILMGYTDSQGKIVCTRKTKVRH